MGPGGFLWLLLFFSGPGAARGPDAGSAPGPGPTPGSGDDGPGPEVREPPEAATAQARPPLAARPPEEEAPPPPRPSPALDVSSLCVCDLLAEECDVNCCCDPDCTSTDFSLFLTCSVPIVSDDSHFCFQKIAVYEMNFTTYPPERVFRLDEKVNPSIFCLYTLNYREALSFIPPELPNENNFDDFLKKFGNSVNTKDSDIFHPPTLNAPAPNKYKYKSPVQTSDSFLKLPCPLLTSQCIDNNPVGFLINESFQCNRKVILEQCNKDKTLSIDHYIQPKIFVEPNSDEMIPITVRNIFLKNLNKTVTRHAQRNVLLQPTFCNISDLEVCNNVVLKVKYGITYTEAGKITKAEISLLLGAVTSSMLPLQQQFQIYFSQENAKSFPLSGNPGYVAGLPILAGFMQNNRHGQFTIFYSTAEQNCLLAEQLRTPILFGYNMMTGCQLKLTESSNCQQVAKELKRLLMGQHFPEFVSSFGNSPTQNMQAWVPVHEHFLARNRQESCEIPVALEITVKWTKYGSLLNPQAKIVSVEANMISYSFSENELELKRTIQISTVVSFVDVSAPAKASYKAKPTIDAKLPSNFFFPFV
ncbi:tectonic-1 isoform X2 [Macrotis lagotis]|uniref:tectonic-1 isoform X2 n=1 Tax=Macrotis lagotis TaxID=92651 RepID=UPI003D69EEA7